MNGTIADRYIVVESLGHGGMADVYLAMDSVLNREVAIKVLRGELSNDPIALLRFQREANAASALNHPNIVEIYDVGEWEGKQFIVMEYVRGKTLKQLIVQRGAIEQKEAVAIMQQLVEATAAAHQRNIIHRDIKPQNVLIKDDGTVKITDFGIALAQDAVQLTQTDSVMGSVHYLAPELARGETATQQSDIYALGIVLYELLTGEVPYRGDSAVQIAMKHMREDLPDVRATNATIYQSVENIIIKATAKNKALRYMTTKEMLKDLKTVLSEKRIHEPKLTLTRIDANDKTIAIDKVTKEAETGLKPKNLLSTTLGFLFIGIASIAIVLIIALANPWGNGSKEIEMINLTGKTVEKATEELTALGLTVTKINYQVTDDIPEGLIISSSPSAGSVTEKGSSVTLTVSDGTYFIIQNYAGKTESEVRSLLAGKKIMIKVQKEVTELVKPGVVIRQELLQEGDKVDPNLQYEIKLIVSGYLEFAMPTNLVGMNVFDAQNLLKSKGAEVLLHPLSTDGLTQEELDAIVFNTVVKVTPASGLYIQYEDSSIVLYYY